MRKVFTQYFLRVVLFVSFLFGVNLSIAQITPFTMHLTPVDQTCTGNGQVSIDIDGTQAGAEFEFQLFQLPNLAVPVRVTSGVTASGNDLTHVETSLSPGNYRLVAIQFLGVTSNQQFADITIGSNVQALAFNLTQIEVYGGKSITVNVSSGFPETFELLDTSNNEVLPAQASNIFENVAEGNYIVRVTDVCGNRVTQGVTVVYDADVEYSLLRETTQITASSLYGFSVIDDYNTLRHKELLSFNGSTTIPENYFPISVTISIENPLGGPDTVINTVWNSNADNDEEFSIPFYPDQTYDYTIAIEDNCGNTFSLTNTIEANFDFIINSFNTICDQNNFTIRRYWFGSPPYTVEFLNYPIGFSPWESSSKFPDGSMVGTGITDWLEFGNQSISIPTGVYEVKITDACGRSTTKSRNVSAQNINHNLRDRGSYGGCNVDEGSIQFYVRSNNNVPQGANIVQANFTSFPAAYTGPTDVSSSIKPNGWITLSNLPAGDYTIETLTDCGTSPSRDFTILGVSINSKPEINYNCNSFDLDYTLESNLRFEKVYLPRYDENLGQWVHPTNGTPYTEGQSLNSATGLFIFEDDAENIGIWDPQETNNYIESISGSLLNITTTGNFRIIVEHNNFGPNQSVETCFTVADTFSISNERISLNNYFVASCLNGNTELVIDASGVSPLNYRIVELNGSPLLINNGEDPVFSQLEAGEYTVEVEDNCGNIRVFKFKTDIVKEPIIRANNLCAGGNGSLFVPGLTFMTIEWRKGNDPTVIATGNTLNFSPFNIPEDIGIYTATLIYDPNPNACISQVLSFEVQSPAPAPISGTGQSINIPQEDAGIMNLFDYLIGPYDNFGNWVDLSNTGLLNNEVLDASTLSVGTYQFEYTVNGVCVGSESTIVTVVIIPSSLTAVTDSFDVLCPSIAYENVINVMEMI